MNFLTVVLDENTIKNLLGEPEYYKVFERVTDIILKDSISFDSSNMLTVKKQFVVWEQDKKAESSSSYEILGYWLKQLKLKFPKIRIHLQIEVKGNWKDQNFKQLDSFQDFFDFEFVLNDGFTTLFYNWFLQWRKASNTILNIGNISVWGYPNIKNLIQKSLFTVHRTYGLFRYEMYAVSDTTCRVLKPDSDMSVSDSLFVYEKCLKDFEVNSKLVLGLPTFCTYFEVEKNAVLSVKSVFRSEVENAIKAEEDWTKDSKFLSGTFKIENPKFIIYYDQEKVVQQKLNLFIKDLGFKGCYIENLGFDLVPMHPNSIYQQILLWIDRDGWISPESSAWNIPTILETKHEMQEDQIMEPIQDDKIMTQTFDTNLMKRPRTDMGGQ